MRLWGLDFKLGSWVLCVRKGNAGCSFWDWGHCALVISGSQDPEAIGVGFSLSLSLLCMFGKGAAAEGVVGRAMFRPEAKVALRSEEVTPKCRNHSWRVLPSPTKEQVVGLWLWNAHGDWRNWRRSHKRVEPNIFEVMVVESSRSLQHPNWVQIRLLLRRAEGFPYSGRGKSDNGIQIPLIVTSKLQCAAGRKENCYGGYWLHPKLPLIEGVCKVELIRGIKLEWAELLCHNRHYIARSITGRVFELWRC